jgi:hypothetical protein
VPIRHPAGSVIDADGPVLTSDVPEVVVSRR